MIRPSENWEEGGRYATAFTNPEAFRAIFPSYVGGLSERSDHNRTVPSLDDDTTAFDEGKHTARTCISSLISKEPQILQRRKWGVKESEELTSSSWPGNDADSL
jgi:hypothetical protein